MVKEAIGTGETVLAAQEAACKELGVETHEAEFEVLQMPEKKLFGLFGGSPAKVRAYIATTPAQAAEEYLRDVLTHMGVNDVELTVEAVSYTHLKKDKAPSPSTNPGKRGCIIFFL